MNRAPEVLGWLYDCLDRPWKHERLRLALEKLNARPFVKLLTSYQPDWIVCTHFLPAELVAWFRSVLASASDRLPARARAALSPPASTRRPRTHT